MNASKEGETHRFSFDWHNVEPSAAIMEALSSVEGVPLTEIGPVLYRTVDPDALDTLIQESPPIRVELRIGKCDVVIEDNVVTVR